MRRQKLKPLASIREDLEIRRGVLSERLHNIGLDRQRWAQALSADFAEQAVERENDEVLDRLDESVRADLRQVKRALAHFDRGMYGFCEKCGEAIDAARLHARPEATNCMRCASE